MYFHSSNRQEGVSERLQNAQCICRRQCVSPIQCKRCEFLRLIMSSKVATCTTGDGHSSEDHIELLMARSVIDSSTKVPCCHDERTQLHERPSHFYGTDCSKACACHGPYAPQQRGCWLSKYGLKSLARLSVSFVVSNRLPPTHSQEPWLRLFWQAPHRRNNYN